MNFFKKMFSSKKEESNSDSPNDEVQSESKNEEHETNSADSRANLEGAYTQEYFDTRYSEYTIDAETLTGCLKMVESYFVDNQIERKIESPINHPINLDQVDQEGFGFVLYCSAFELGEGQATLFLAFSFSEYLINKYGFKLFKDSQPESPLRSMTLKYDKDGVILSLYPYEYASKVLNENVTFTEMEERLNAQFSQLPNYRQ